MTNVESSDVERLAISPEDAGKALDVVIHYLYQIAKWKEKEGFTEVPKIERKKANELNRLKLYILSGKGL